MKNLSLLFLILFISGSVTAQEKNKTIIDDETGKPMLTGYTTREAFSDTSFSWWFDSEYKMYEPDSVSLQKLYGKLDDIKVTIVMGSWCSDSKREVPRFFKILDKLNYPSDSVTIISVNRDKKSDEGNVGSLAIELVPTIIFYKNDSELGRITESPEVSLEKDMIKIIVQ